MKPVDFLDRSTHRNWPAPHLDPSLVQALIDIVGLNPYGEPNARFVWGQEVKRFQWGKDRLAYIDTRIPAIRHTRHVLKRIKFVETKTVSIPVGVEDGMIEYREVVQEIPHYEKKFLTEVPRVIAPGWLYELELINLEWIGEQLWILEQWYPPEYFGTESQWNRVRYQRWQMQWAPESDVKVITVGDADSVTEDDDGIKTVRRLRGAIVDAIGPFPATGAYRSLRFLGEPYEYMRPVVFEPIPGHKVREWVKDVHLAYRAPGQDTLEAVREAWQDRETRKEYTPEQLGRMRLDAYNEAEEKATQESARLHAEKLEDRRKKIQIGYGS